MIINGILHYIVYHNGAYMNSILIVTGISGAGKSVVLRSLEDAGFFCVDNLPSQLLPSFFEYARQQAQGSKVALGLDVRSGHNMNAIAEEIKKQRNVYPGTITIIYLTAHIKELVKRFQETRRAHPFGAVHELRESLEKEQDSLVQLRSMADHCIETDQLTIHELRALIRSFFIGENRPRMIVHVISFGFKYGVPVESNFVYDVRSLPNPYFVPELKALSGVDARVYNYLFEQDLVQEYWNKWYDFVIFSLEKSYHEGRSFVYCAIGCTGGRHRSVAIAEKLAKTHHPTIQFMVKHRDMYKEGI